jgi:predicted nucleotidyltransferase
VQDAASDESVTLYLFGSALRTVYANDLDILIVYNKRFLSVAEALSLRRDLSQSISVDLGICADCVLLTKQEAEQTNFGLMEGAVLISPNAIDLIPPLQGMRHKRRAPELAR